MRIKYLNPSFIRREIPDPLDSNGVKKFIEKIARTCYKSEGYISVNDASSAENLLRQLLRKNHQAMLEHYIFTFSVSAKVYKSIYLNPIIAGDNNKYIDSLKYLRCTHFKNADKDDPEFIISGSIRGFNQLFENQLNNEKDNYGLFHIYSIIQTLIPEATYANEVSDREKIDDVQVLTIDDIRSLPKEIRQRHNWYSYKLITDRAVTHELVRHRPVSYAQESTRYLNYKNKGYSIILPYWMNEDIKKAFIENNDDPELWKTFDQKEVIYSKHWALSVENALKGYNYFLEAKDKKFTPQDVKRILDETIKTEINVTTFEDEWVHILNLRTAPDAYPGIKKVLDPVLNDIIDIQNTFKDTRNDFLYVLLRNEQEESKNEN